MKIELVFTSLCVVACLCGCHNDGRESQESLCRRMARKSLRAYGWFFAKCCNEIHAGIQHARNEGRDVAVGEIDQDKALRGSLSSWIETCCEIARRPADELIGACESHAEYKQEYNIVYYDDRYLSFKGDEWWYEGGAHGNGLITVGVIDRKNGKRLKLADLVPPEKLPKLQLYLYDEVVKKIGGKDQLLGEVKPIENFYVDKDGLHFLYNAYEVACYATGPVDVAVPFPFE